MLEAKISGIIDNKEFNKVFEFDRNGTLDESLKTFLDNLELENAKKPLNLYEECRTSSKLVAEIYQTTSI
jgi:poly(3-hydroxyalkanoate) synthetase